MSTRDIAAHIREYVSNNASAAWAAVIGSTLTQKGDEYYARCFLHDDTDASPDLRISFDKAKWCCDPCRCGGDIFDLEAAKLNLSVKTDFARIVRELANLFGLHTNGAGAARKSSSRDDGEIVWPLRQPWIDANGMPSPMPALPKRFQGATKGDPIFYAYRNASNELLMFTVRFDLADGSKEVLPLTLWRKKGGPVWRWKGPPEPRPLYGLESLALHPDKPALIAEGEKCVDTARDIPLRHVATTWSGGGNSVAKAKWEILSERNTPVVMWPDNDAAGAQAALDVAAELGRDDLGFVIPNPAWKEGYDIADAIADGMTPEQIAAIISAAVPLEEFEKVAIERWPELRNIIAPTVEISSDNPSPVEVEDSEITLSNLFVQQYGAGIRFVHGLGDLVYDTAAGCWIEDKKRRIYTLAKRTLVNFANEIYKAAKKRNKPLDGAVITRMKDLTDAKKVAAIVSLARSHTAVAASSEEFDANRWLLNTPGRALYLRDGSGRDSRREDLFRKCTNVTPQEMETPTFDRFLAQIMGRHMPLTLCQCAVCLTSEGQLEKDRQELHDAEVRALVAYLLRLLGAALPGYVTEQILVLLTGGGGNGKGALIRLLEYVLGAYVLCLPIEALLEPKGERHLTELVDLKGARIAFAQEPEGHAWNSSRVKMLTGDDTISARRMRQDLIRFSPSHMLIVSTNGQPRLRGSDQQAWKRRLHLIPFQVSFDNFEDNNRGIFKLDPTLEDDLKKEAPGILHKIIQGCIAWQKDGLKPPLTVLHASARYLKEQNALQSCLADKCVADVNGKTSANELWSIWCKWTEENHEWAGARREFNERLRNTGIQIKDNKHARGICYEIRPRTVDDKPDILSWGEKAEADVAKKEQLQFDYRGNRLSNKSD